MQDTSIRRRSWRTVAVSMAAVLLLALVMLVGPLSATRWGLAVTWSLALLFVLWTLRRHRIDRLRYEENLRTVTAERARAEQRLELAHRLHDQLSATLGAITLQSSIAARSPQTISPTQALATIERSSRAATAELRTMLLDLRDVAAPAAPSAAVRITGAMQKAHRHGIAITADHSVEDPDALDLSQPALDVVTSVIEEGLVNIGRHCGPTTARVRIVRGDHSASALVEDDGPGGEHVAVPGTGFGLQGLHELVGARGGRVEAGPRPEGPGWRLLATIPLQDGA
ncbi:MAG: sensor histidine kinase [Brachybacterium sp.]